MPGELLSVFLQAWLFSLVALIVYRTATGQIDLRGLLTDSNGQFSPERGQLLLASLTSVAVYAQDALRENGLVEPSAVVLSGFAGSQALYVATKYLRNFFSNQRTTGG